MDAGLTLKKCTKSTKMTLYLKDGRHNELYQYNQHLTTSSHRVNFKIEKGTRLAAYVAHSKQYIVTEDCGSEFLQRVILDQLGRFGIRKVVQYTNFSKIAGNYPYR